METVNSIAAAASKVIWGEPQETTDAANATIVPETKGTEPISGELGDTKKGEPYDLGNADSTSTQKTLSSTTDGATSTFTPTDSTTLSPPGLAAKPLESSSTSTSVSPTPDSVSHTLAETHIAPLSDSTSTPSTSTPIKVTSEKPLISEHINPNLPEPSAAAEKSLSSSIPSTNIPSSTTATSTTSNTVDPAPLSRLAVETPNPTGKPSSTANAQGVPTDLQPLGSKSSSEKPETSTSESTGTATSSGTGEKHIKSSGLVAEGGDFDATRPGAGKGADRLLGKDGKSTVGGNTEMGSEEERDHEHEHGEGKKEGKLTHLKEKIKEKLHKH
ncbi:uncharacterized protein EAE97_005709 [Botrytis byssoidea]|uniref:Uncharacterized protein n=1 Tax=Botrytis byssoidea TaxID=139641 RepID=A0A9P5IM28_9HELO|nr:uncharacterized protein EAE97_005709 [Botrytis byssoidea]KAF7943638.1 hypothetical protein EAE97_005709 [Botrytis byssoidea]